MTPATCALLTALIALQFGDILTTRRVLAQGGRELNPLMARLMGAIGVLPALVVAKLGLIVLIVITQLPYYLLAALCALYAYVVWRNWRLLK